jgi:hypothetical protein
MGIFYMLSISAPFFGDKLMTSEICLTVLDANDRSIDLYIEITIFYDYIDTNHGERRVWDYEVTGIRAYFENKPTDYTPEDLDEWSYEISRAAKRELESLTERSA